MQCGRETEVGARATALLLRGVSLEFGTHQARVEDVKTAEGDHLLGDEHSGSHVHGHLEFADMAGGLRAGKGRGEMMGDGDGDEETRTWMWNSSSRPERNQTFSIHSRLHSMLTSPCSLGLIISRSAM